MLRTIVLAVGLVDCSLSLAQTQFSRRYDSYDQMLVQEAWAVELRPDSGYFVVHMSYLADSPGDYVVNCVLILDQQGDLDTITHVALDTLTPLVFCGWTNTSDRTLDGGLVVGGSTNSSGTNTALLIKYDSSGNFEAMHSYAAVDSSFIGRQAKQTLSGEYVLVGSCSSNGNTDGSLLKADANGVFQWSRTYPAPSINSFVSVDLAPGGGYYLGGMRFVAGQSWQNWVLRVDQVGEVIWERTWGGLYQEPNAHLQTASDGQAVICSLRATSVGGSGKLYMAKLDSTDGSFVWEHDYGGPTFNSTLFAVKEVVPFGDLIATGQAFQNNGEVGVLLRTTTEGDSLWMRYYNYHDALVDSGDAQLRDVLPTPDGGFVAVGVAFGIGPYSQDVWVVKTDSMGCIEPGCHLIQGMQTQITNLRGALTARPNPVASGGIVQVGIALPNNFTPQGALKLTLVSVDGRVVQEQTMPSGVSAFSFHLSAFLPGLYHLHLTDATRWISGTKLLVE